MKKFFLGIFSLLILLTSCKGNEDDPQPTPAPSDDEITILAYLVANNNLDMDLLINIGAMYDGLGNMDQQATLLIYWDGRSKLGSNGAQHLILKYQTDGKGNINGLPKISIDAPLNDVLDIAEIVKEYDTQSSVDKNVMSQVLKDMVDMAPSSKLGLVFGSHASSWLNTIYTRSFGQDGSGDYTILIPDMVEAISSTDKDFEFILFDACYMGTIEVAYAFRNLCKYQLSSVMEVPAYGFPYEDFMPYLYNGDVESYKRVCQMYIEYYQGIYASGSQGAWGTVALIDSKEVGNLVNEIKKEIVEHKDVLANYSTAHLQEYGRHSSPYIACDLGQMISDLNGESIPAAFSSQLAKTVLHKGCLEKGRYYSYDYDVDATNYCGLGIYIPVDKRPKWNVYFKTLDWYTASGWSEVTFSWNF